MVQFVTYGECSSVYYYLSVMHQSLSKVVKLQNKRQNLTLNVHDNKKKKDSSPYYSVGVMAPEQAK